MSRFPSETDQTQTITTQSQDRTTLNLNMPREVKLVLVVLGMVALIGGWFVLTGQPGQNDAGVDPVTEHTGLPTRSFSLLMSSLSASTRIDCPAM